MEKDIQIIIIDDEENLALNLRDIMEEQGYSVESAFEGKTGLEMCRENEFDIAFVDIKLPDTKGTNLVKEIEKVSPDTGCILMTGYASLESAVEAVKQKKVMAYEIKPLDMNHILPLIKEIAARKEVEASLGKSEKRYREMAELLPDAIYEMDTSMKFTYANRSAFGMLGYDVEDLETGVNLIDLMGEKYLELARQKLAERSESMLPGLNEYMLYRKDGSSFFCEVTSAACRDDDGEIIGFRGVVRDISERKAAEEEQVRLETAIKQVAEVIIITDKDGVIQYVNPAFETVSGYMQEDVIGKDFLTSMRDTRDKNSLKTIKDTVGSGAVWKGRMTNIKKDGSSYEVEATLSPVLDGLGDIVNLVSVQRDVTREIEIAKQLRQAQKMEAIGTLAGGIAHDFNNILGAIIGNVEIMEMFDIPAHSPLQERIQQVLRATDRAKELVRQILAFSRQHELERRHLEIAPIVRETLKFLRASLPATIDIRQNIETRNGTIVADPTQMHQVLMNLCTNAAHAMSETGGLLEVFLDEIDLDDRKAREFIGLESGPYVRLKVKDTGEGIGDEVIDRIFDPYFTTKEIGRGTGLGLAVVHGIIRGHGGAITVSSNKGEGSVFEVFLPRVDGGQIEIDHELDILPVGGTEHILFVDDEKDLVEIAERTLSHLGYRVSGTTDSLEALELFRDQADQFDLVITDLTMPRMTGLDLATKLLEIRPGIPIIVCTGFSEYITKEKSIELGFRDFLNKPFGSHELADAIRKALD